MKLHQSCRSIVAVIVITIILFGAKASLAKPFEDSNPPPDRGAPSRTSDGGTRAERPKADTPDLTGRGRPDDRRGGASKSQEGDYKPRDNGGPATSQGSGTRFTW